MGNRTSETNAAVTDSYTYPATNNKLQSIVRNAATVRSFTYDNAGNMATDVRSGTTFAYGYNNANRLKTVTSSGNLLGTYTPDRFCSHERAGPGQALQRLRAADQTRDHELGRGQRHGAYGS